MLISSPFGSRSRTRVLVALHIVGYSYPRALARLLDIPIFALRKALAGLERDGLVVVSPLGRLRLYRLDTTYPAHAELAAYLSRLAEIDGELRARLTPAPVDTVPVPALSAPPSSEVLQPAAASSVAQPRPRPPSRTRGEGAPDGWRNW